jgi:hypothetical protein
MALRDASNGAHADGRDGRPPAVLLISIAGAMMVLALAAAWLWITRGAAILMDIGQIFCM